MNRFSNVCAIHSIIYEIPVNKINTKHIFIQKLTYYSIISFDDYFTQFYFI
jgi:hypothetical protein